VPARVLVIGLDSAESTLVSRWVSEGKLHALAELAEEGTTYRLDNCWHTLPTSVWPELTSGRSPGKLALFFPPSQLRTGEAEPRPVTAEDVDPAGFWTIASEAGKRVAAIDLPWTVPPRELNGIFLAEWGTHDRWFGTASLPATFADDVRTEYGAYPVRLCDHDYGDSPTERERLARELLEAVDQETRLLRDLLHRDDWDLFACAFGQFQCVGHNFWGLMDAGDGVPHSLRDAMLDVYAKVDEGIAVLREAAGADAVSVVVASHGMGPLAGGPQLLSEVLVRLGAGSGSGSAAQVRSRLPMGVRSAIRTLVPGPLRRRLQRAAGSLPAPLSSSATKAVALPADIGGYLRLNVVGREPNGSLEPGAEAETELEHLRRALLELEEPASGERIVTGVVSADDACVSERVGLVKVPHRIANRSGDHTGEARLWLAGPRIRPTEGPGSAHALDVAPTILSLLEVPIPPDLDGKSLVERVD
jgi:predicted AlkP superfamily phosphohydrolase/phosphomutase